MTDEERNANIERIKKRTLASIFGDKATSVDVEVPDVEYHTVDKNWNSGKLWMNQPRFTNPMNNDMEGIAEFNKKIHDNNGVVVTVMHKKPGFAAEPIK